MPLPDISIKLMRLPHGADLPLPSYASEGAAGLAMVAAEEDASEPPALTPESEVEIRTVEKRYIYVDGRPIGPPLDDASALEAGPPRR